MDHDYYGNEVPDDREDKLFIGFMSVCITLLGLAVLGLILSLIVAMWQAGFISFVGWSLGFGFIAWISKFVYRHLIKSDWL